MLQTVGMRGKKRRRPRRTKLWMKARVAVEEKKEKRRERRERRAGNRGTASSSDRFISGETG